LKTSLQQKQSGLEWVFLGLLITVSSVLTVLQFSWTGELAEAERVRRDGALQEQAERLVTEAGREWSETFRRLRPSAEDAAGTGEAWVTQLRKARDAGVRPLFKWLGLVRLSDDEPVLFVPDLESGVLKPAASGEAWEAVKRRVWMKPGGFGSPLAAGDAMEDSLLEWPLMRERDASRLEDQHPLRTGFGDLRDPRNAPGLVVMQVDADYVRRTWIPELMERYLGRSGEFVQGVVVRSGAGASGRVLYMSAAVPKGAAPVFTAPVELNMAPQSGRGFPGRGPRMPAWILEVYRKPGALEAVVAATRRKNLLAAFLLNGLILAAGGLLVRQTRRSRRLAETQMQFVAGVSHELRTPLTVIRGAAHNIKRGIVHDPERIVHYAGLVEDHAAQLTRMVEQVLEFSRAGKTDARQAFKPLNLDDVLRQAVSATVAETQAAHCTVELQLPPVAIRISGDGEALLHAFQNLIVNAAKHGGSGGWIGVTAAEAVRERRRMAEVRVMDRGPGIPEHERVDVFKPFYRGERARSTQTRGSGLGLSLVKTTVEDHGGGIRIAGEAGGGATFVIELPVAEEQRS
jgi:signal transduction histidine kinase